MAFTVNQIEQAIILADAYSFKLLDEVLAEQKKGCMDCCDITLIESIIDLTYMLERRIYQEVPILDEDTASLYTCLQTKLIGYSGAGGSINPNAVIPNTTIIVEIIGNDSPYELMFGWSDFINNGQDGRVRYENPAWAGWTPLLELNNVALNYGITGVADDYEVLTTGGFVLLNTGNVQAIYDGQVMRSLGYEPYVAPMPPYTGKILIDNQSSQSITYSDNFGPGTTLTAGSQYLKDPLIDNQSINIQLVSGQTCTETQYNADGTVQYTTSFSNPPTTGTLYTNLSINKGHTFIITNS